MNLIIKKKKTLQKEGENIWEDSSIRLVIGKQFVKPYMYIFF